METAKLALPISFDERPIAKRVGLVVLGTCNSTEPDFHRLVSSSEVGLFAARVAYDNPTTPANLRNILPKLTDASSLILQGEQVDVICFSGTSASVVIGDDEVSRAIKVSKPEAAVVTPTIAALSAFVALGVGSIDILTPYNREVSVLVADYFDSRRCRVNQLAYLDLDDDREMARISHKSIVEAAVRSASQSADALFISCTALRSAAVAAEIEQRIGKPVVTSNLATTWMTLGILGEQGSSCDARLYAQPFPKQE